MDAAGHGRRHVGASRPGAPLVHARRNDPVPWRAPPRWRSGGAWWGAAGAGFVLLGTAAGHRSQVLGGAGCAGCLGVLADPATVQALGNSPLFTTVSCYWRRCWAWPCHSRPAVAAAAGKVAVASLPLVLSPISVAFGLLLLYPSGPPAWRC